MLIAAPSSALAVERRRVCRREEAREQTGLTALLNEYLDPRDTFWTSLENKPLSPLSGLFQKQRGVRSGLPDIVVIWRGKPIFIELKSRAGVASKAQKQVHAELKAAGASWWMARSRRAAITALALEGVVFRRKWKPPRLKPYEGPFADPNVRLPQAPEVLAQRRAARKRWRLRHANRARETAKRAAQRDDIAGGDIAA
jgi:hypothetical protein